MVKGCCTQTGWQLAKKTKLCQELTYMYGLFQLLRLTGQEVICDFQVSIGQDKEGTSCTSMLFSSPFFFFFFLECSCAVTKTTTTSCTDEVCQGRISMHYLHCIYASIYAFIDMWSCASQNTFTSGLSNRITTASWWSFTSKMHVHAKCKQSHRLFYY